MPGTQDGDRKSVETLCYFHTFSVVKPAVSTFCSLGSSAFTRHYHSWQTTLWKALSRMQAFSYLKLERDSCSGMASKFFFSPVDATPNVLNVKISLAFKELPRSNMSQGLGGTTPHKPCFWGHQLELLSAHALLGKAGPPASSHDSSTIQWHYQKPHSFFFFFFWNTPSPLFPSTHCPVCIFFIKLPSKTFVKFLLGERKDCTCW